MFPIFASISPARSVKIIYSKFKKIVNVVLKLNEAHKVDFLDGDKSGRIMSLEKVTSWSSS